MVANKPFKNDETNLNFKSGLVDKAILYQNAPNPFSESTEIKFSIPQRNQSAMICIYNMNGTQLKSLPLHLNGEGRISIDGNELKAGMYMYSLIADGQVIDTKQMILTD